VSERARARKPAWHLAVRVVDDRSDPWREPLHSHRHACAAVALFEPRLVPSFVAAMGPPLMIITSLGETVIPVLDRFQKEMR
jgi:hypothetical protein